MSRAAATGLIGGVACFLAAGMYVHSSNDCLATGFFAASAFWMFLHFLVMAKCVNGETRHVGFWLDFTELSVLLTPFPILAACYGTCLT